MARGIITSRLTYGERKKRTYQGTGTLHDTSSLFFYRPTSLPPPRSGLRFFLFCLISADSSLLSSPALERKKKGEGLEWYGQGFSESLIGPRSGLAQGYYYFLGLEKGYFSWFSHRKGLVLYLLFILFIFSHFSFHVL